MTQFSLQDHWFFLPRSPGTLEANLWTSDATLPSGGLVLYGVGPPKEWGFEKYNSESKNSQIQDLSDDVRLSRLVIFKEMFGMIGMGAVTHRDIMNIHDCHLLVNYLKLLLLSCKYSSLALHIVGSCWVSLLAHLARPLCEGDSSEVWLESDYSISSKQSSTFAEMYCRAL